MENRYIPLGKMGDDLFFIDSMNGDIYRLSWRLNNFDFNLEKILTMPV